MQKLFNVVTIVAIVVLATWAYLQSRTIKRIEALIPKPTPPTPIMGDRTSITGGELWDAIQNKVKEMTVDLTFNNNQP